MISEMFETGTSRTIFSQTVGTHVLKTVWAEAFVTLGNLKNYNDHKALYIYNSIDPTTFRSGLTLFWYLGKSVTLIGNYTYDTKEIELVNRKYQQYSFSGGIIWKL